MNTTNKKLYSLEADSQQTRLGSRHEKIMSVASATFAKFQSFGKIFALNIRNFVKKCAVFHDFGESLVNLCW